MGTAITMSASAGASSGEDAAHLAAGLVHGHAGDPRVGAAPGRRTRRCRAALRGLSANRTECSPRSSIRISSPGSTSRTGTAPTMSRPQVSEATQNPLGRLPIDERPHAERIPGRVDAPLVHHHEAERALELRQDVAAPPPRGRPPAIVAGSMVATRSVSVVAAPRPPTRSCEVARVHQVAVVAERDRVRAVGLEHRLGVVPRGGAGRGVAGVPDRRGRRSAW